MRNNKVLLKMVQNKNALRESFNDGTCGFEFGEPPKAGRQLRRAMKRKGYNN